MKINKIGTWITLNSFESTEIILQYDFDWICIDLEHSTIPLESVGRFISLAEKYKKKVYVRIPDINKSYINRILDAGADGLIVANIKDSNDIQACIDATFYPPKGKRGMGLVRANEYGKKFNIYKNNKSKKIEIIPIIESRDAIDNLEDILSKKEIKKTMIGPYDLSSSLGQPGDFKSNLFKSLIKRYKDCSLSMGKEIGIHVVEPSIKDLNQKIKENYQFIAFSTDAIILDRALSSALESI
tara:strand:- start:23903 stop:24628 length:726 start_codon:yes stop_codon:yes gene_type:complete